MIDKKKINKKIFSEVAKEFNTFIAGRENLSAKELLSLRKYVKARTNLKTLDKNLTEEEKARKYFYETTDSLLGRTLSSKDKLKLDNAEDFIEYSNIIADKASKLENLSLEIERILVKQELYINVYLDKSEENPYKFPKENMEKAMLAEETPTEERINIANLILKLVSTFKKIYPLQDLSENLDNKNAEFIRTMKEIESLNESNKELIKRFKNEITRLDTLTSMNKRFSLVKETSLARNMVINGIWNQLELDEYLPSFLIKNKGDKDINLSKKETNDFANKMKSYYTSLVVGIEKENKIREEKDNLTKEIFGDIDEQFIQEIINENKGNNNQTDNSSTARHKNPLNNKWWFRLLKVIYIILWIIGIGIILLIASSSEEKVSVGFRGILIVSVILTGLKKGFYYISLGRFTP